jgi:cytochrome c-type biogenesis protein CcmF
VDLGLYNQLLVWIVAIAALGFGLFAWRYRELPTPKNPPATLSRETMIFTGALLLCLLGLVIILGTSAPIIGRLFRDNPAAVPIAFYNTWTLPLAVCIAFLAGLGQLFWWRKMTPENVNRQLIKPLVLTVASTAAVLFLTPFVDVTVDAPMLPSGAGPALAATPEATQAALLPPALSVFWEHYGMSLMLLLLLFGSFFALYGNGAVLLKVARGNLKMAGGAITHIGFALMLLGIFSSSVFNDPITDGRGASVGGDRDNFVLTPGERRVVDGFIVSYESEHVNERGHREYAVEFMDPRGRSFTATMAVFRDNRGQVIQHPHVQKYIGGDIYVAAFPSWMTRDDDDPTDATDVVIQRGDSTMVGPYSVHFRDYALEVDFETVGLDPTTTQLAVGAVLEVTNTETGQTRTMRPVYAIDNEDHAQFIQTRATDWNLTVTFTAMQVDRDAIRLVFEGPGIAPPEWLLVQAYQKPMISLLWLGTIILIFGFGVAFYRRATEARVAGGSVS